MRAFVTGTGRCGTVTFSEACRHADNYTCGHETHTNLGSCSGRIACWEYADGHIEVSHHLVIAIPLLRDLYPNARWVHLVRDDREACARSLARRFPLGAFARVWFFRRTAPLMPAAYAFYDTVNALCRALIPDAFVLHLETAEEQWADCWEFLGCQGDFDASLAEWSVRHNATQPSASRSCARATGFP